MSAAKVGTTTTETSVISDGFAVLRSTIGKAIQLQFLNCFQKGYFCCYDINLILGATANAAKKTCLELTL